MVRTGSTLVGRLFLVLGRSSSLLRHALLCGRLGGSAASLRASVMTRAISRRTWRRARPASCSRAGWSSLAGARSLKSSRFSSRRAQVAPRAPPATSSLDLRRSAVVFFNHAISFARPTKPDGSEMGQLGVRRGRKASRASVLAHALELVDARGPGLDDGRPSPQEQPLPLPMRTLGRASWGPACPGRSGCTRLPPRFTWRVIARYGPPRSAARADAASTRWPCRPKSPKLSTVSPPLARPRILPLKRLPELSSLFG